MKRLLVANRGEIALRIARTAHRLGIATAAIYSDTDRDAPHVRALDTAVAIGPGPVAESYSSIDAVLGAAAAAGADAVHPGYGFLAESAEFAERCEAAGLTFVGPSAAAMRALGNKANAKQLLAGRGVPFLPGYHAADQTDAALTAAAHDIGMPLMIKAAAGGGGRGMRLVLDAQRFPAALREARSEAYAAFGNADVLLERALIAPRHVEVQIFADAFGNVVHLGERDCSVQRRHQKLIEEAPSPAVDAALRERLSAAALLVARATPYAGAATVEFLLDAGGAFYFIEVNTRLQVEHPVTEAITGIDLVEWQLRIARGEPLPRTQKHIFFAGHAIEARLCAEDPARDFLPQTGVLVAWKPPSGVRVEAALEPGIVISPYYDSMIAKLIGYGTTREDARRKLVRGLEQCVALGVPTNGAALVAYLSDPAFAVGRATTAFVDERAATVARAATPSPAIIALAAVLHFCLAAQRGGFGTWTAWSSTQPPPGAVMLSFGDEPPQTIAVTPRTPVCATATFAGESVEIEFTRLRDGRTRCRVGAEPWRRLDFAIAGTRLSFGFDCRSYTVIDRGGDPPVAATAGAGDGFVRAPMNGRVVRVGGAPGDTLAAGAPLVVVEAMKMEHTLTIPVDIVLHDVNASVGRQVHIDEILMTYAPSAASAVIN